MKKLISSRLFLIILSIVFLLSLLTFFRSYDSYRFRKLSRQLVKNNFENDSLSLHFTFEDPDTYYLNENKISLPCYNRNQYQNNDDQITDTLSALSSIHSDRLTEKAKKTYSLLVPYLKMQLEGSQYPYFEEPLSSTSGVQTSLPILLTEYRIDNKQDIESYLEILSCIPSYFESLGDFETDKAVRGMFMSDKDAETVIAQCDDMCGQNGYQLFHDCFQNSLLNVYSKESDEFSYYLSKHDEILDTAVFPAYEKLGDTILLLKEEEKPQAGLSQYEKGKEYYDYLMRLQTGTDESMEEIREKLSNRLEKVYQELMEAKKKPYQISDQKAELGTQTLKQLQKSMGSLFPPLYKNEKMQYTVKSINPVLSKYNAPAYYFSAPVDNPNRNVIYIGADSSENEMEQFTTLAHEGFPGHMYQNIYFQTSQGVSDDNILRYMLNYPGYSEGWAIYSDLLSYQYSSADPQYARLLRLSREFQLCLMCLLDIQIHYDGASASDIAPYLNRIGIYDTAAIDEIYSYLVNEPANYAKYYVGYLEVLDCLQLYKDNCAKNNEEFSFYDFHKYMLDFGPAPYSIIKKDLLQSGH